MNMILPTDADLQRALPQVQNLQLIDTGGFKAVYRVNLSGRVEALKLIQIPALDGSTDAETFNKEMIGRVRREVDALGRCKVPEIVKLGTLALTALTIGAIDYVVYSEEFLEGSDLWKLLTAGTLKPSEQELRLLFVSLLKAIREVWSLGYVHRDIKPKNVMKLVNQARPFVLLDFGIAYSVQETGLTANATGRLPLATYRYLAPEMMNPTFRETIDYRTDLYTTAMTVYEYGAQRHPLAQDRDDMMRTISRALRQPATPLATHRSDLSAGFCQIIDQMLKKKPALRPANLNALIQRIEKWLMKLFAQHGAAEGDKITEGFNRGLLDGVIYSPRDVSLATLSEKLTALGKASPTAERLLDPQYYAIFLNGNEEARLGYLMEDDYKAYFQPRRRSQLERENQVEHELTAALAFQQELAVTSVIAPNILIPNSLNSIEAVIAKNFVRLTKPAYARLKDPRPVFATLAVSRNALMDKQELIDFVNEITLLDEPPDGFYILISARNTEARSDIYHADVIAGWMFINHTLALNGFRVINGYSDLLTPFLGAAGGAAGALGWWSNLKVFSLDRFAPSGGGGRLPIQRYLSLALLNRITFFEFNQLRTMFPHVINKLGTDALYDPANGSEPQRTVEVLQSWEAVKTLDTRFTNADQVSALKRCEDAVKQAGANYDAVQQLIRLDQKSNGEHVQPLADALKLFAKLAEL